ncbi:hypothetical protein H0901_20120 [Microcystis aeruginosa BLCCF158]|uniref:Uncharacterized protein n=1 Tax=Microcystis aeruginosa BLCC-F158 TaxID=2755316 RepID=A0A841V9A3_MICAE|nr:hypothetical protein [Microcystis aeruginosa]MBC1197490.1 hypothetical protein [Microcystis aeruginosa BLCC-F158]
MNLHLTRQQDHLIQRKVKTGKYQSPENHPLIDGETKSRTQFIFAEMHPQGIHQYDETNIDVILYW